MSSERPREEDPTVSPEYLSTAAQHPTLSFGGTAKDNDKLEGFIRSMRTHTYLMVWKNEPARVIYIIRHLTGPAASWANQNIDEVGCEDLAFGEFVKKLRKRFCKKPDVHRIWNTISRLSEAKLGIRRLNEQFEECCRQFPKDYTVEQIKMDMYYRMFTPRTQSAVHLSQATTLESMDAAFNMGLPALERQPLKTSTNQDDTKGWKDTTRGENGYSENRKQPSNTGKQPIAHYISVLELDDPAERTIIIKNQKISALFDSGSPTSFIRSDMVRLLSLRTYQTPPFRFKGFIPTNESASASEAVNLSFSVENVQITVTAYVLENMDYQLLTGNFIFRPSEIKLSTFLKYKTLISNTVTFDSKTKVVSFKHYTGGLQELLDQLNEFFQPIKFSVKSVTAVNLRAALERKARWKVPTGQVKLEGKTGVTECFKDLMRNVTSLPRDISEPVIQKIDGYTRKASTRAEFPLLFLAAVFNCCRQSDVTNIDPSTFEIVEHEYLGKIVRCLVTETKTRQARHVDLYSVAGRYDPITALHCLLCETKPPKKSFTTSKETSQEYQLLRDALAGTYDRFLAKTTPLTVLEIKNGPKSHFGRHLMASYLSKCNLGQCVTALGNWSDPD